MRLSFLFAFQRLVKPCIAAYPACFARTHLPIVARFCAYLGYFIAFVPFLLCCSDMASFALCLAMCFYDHRGLLRASAATAMPFCRRRYKRRRFSLCSMHGTAYTCNVSSSSRRVVFCGGFWLVLHILCELLRERLRFGDFFIFLPLPRKTVRHTSFQRFRYCPVYAALQADCRLHLTRRHEFAFGCNIIFALFYCRIKTHG